MPEIPDLEAISGFLNKHLKGLTLTETDLTIPWLVRDAGNLDSLIGREFQSARRYGKFLIFEWDGDETLVVNSMLTGRWAWADPSMRRTKASSITLIFANKHELRYSDQRRMGRWYVVPSDGLDRVPGFAELGPDALEIDEETFVTQLARRRGQIKSTLTNQKFLAGIGNAYSDEILWEARLHPHRRAATFDDGDRRRLYRAIGSTFAWAIPLIEEHVRDGLAQTAAEWRDHLRVHRKADEPCPRCGSTVRGQTKGGSETNYCLTCQPLFN